MSNAYRIKIIMDIGIPFSRLPELLDVNGVCESEEELMAITSDPDIVKCHYDVQREVYMEGHPVTVKISGKEIVLKIWSWEDVQWVTLNGKRDADWIVIKDATVMTLKSQQWERLENNLKRLGKVEFVYAD